jgi:RNA polymerase sigma-70 factor (ECF subfamily)
VQAGSPFGSSAVQDFEGCLRAARAGSLEALGRLLDEYRPYMLGIANEELDADLRPKGGPSDLVQESLLEASRDFANFRGRQQEELLAWLRGILRNNLADFRRKHREAACRDPARERCLEPDNAAWLRRDTPGPLGKVLERERLQALEQAIASLPEEYRVALQLRHRDNYSFAEIGARLERSEEAARKVWCRAVDRLRELLKESGHDSC